MINHSLFYFKKSYLYHNHKYFIILKDQYQMVATTMFGLEPLLKKELKSIGAKNTKIGNRCVYFQGNKKLMYKSNIALRTALKILKNLKTFRSNTASDLYKYVGKIKWFTIFNPSNTFSVSSTVNSKHFKHSNYVSLIVKDAIVDQFRMKFKDRPSVDLKNPDFNIHIHISNNECIQWFRYRL